MARLWQSGWELNSITTDVEWSNVTGTGATIQTAVTRSGGNAARTNPAAATAFFRYHYSTSNLSTVAYLRVYMRIAALPGANSTVIRFVDAANNPCAQIRLTATGTLVLLDAASNPVGAASAALNLNQWYRIELGLDASTSPGSVEGRIDGVTFASGANSAQVPWARLLIGPVVAATCDIYWDDAALNDNSGTVQNSWPGEGKILHLIPGGDGDAHGWSNTANGAGTATNWQLVDDVPPNDTTDYVQSGTLNAEDFYALTDSGIGSGDAVNCVLVGLRLRNNTADAVTAVKAELKKTSGGTIAQGTAIIPNSTSFATNAPVQPRNYTLITYTDPDGAAWTQSTLDSAQAGIKITAAGTNRIQVSAVWVSVDYTPASGSSASLTDTATGADAATAAAAATITDTATGVDGLAPVAATLLADTATAADAVTARAAATAGDTGSAVDSIGAAAAAAFGETATGVDAATATAAAPLPDTASALDDLTVARAISLTDTATALDAVTVGAAAMLTDQATAADTTTTAATVALGDQAGADDTATAAAQAALADAGAAIDDVALGSPLALDDGATTADGIATATAAPVQDAATAAEAITAAAATALGEAATAVDALTIDMAVALTDAATAAEAMTVPPPLVPGVLTVAARPSAAHTVRVTGSVTAAGASSSTMEVTAT